MTQKNLISIASKLEGFKIIFKEAHWNCFPKSTAVHKILDDCYATVHSFEDSFNEEGTVIFGSFGPGELTADRTGISVTNDAKELFKELLSFAYEIKQLVKDDIILCGLSAKVDTFVSDIYHQIYLLKFEYAE